VSIEDDVAALLACVGSHPSEELESETVEFKEYSSEHALHNAKDLAEEISAFSNHKGGVVVIGVRDSSNVKNQRWQDQLRGFGPIDLDTAAERITGRLRPRLRLRFVNVEFEGRNYLAIDVPQRGDTLVSTTSGKVCIRDGKSSRPMDPDEIERAVKLLRDYDWSSEILDCPADGLLDNTSLAEAYDGFMTLRGLEGVGQDGFLEAIGATSDGNLTRTGLLFLGRRAAIRSHLGLFEFRFSRKTRGGDLRVNEIWDDCIWTSVKRAEELFEQCNDPAVFTYEQETYRAQLVDRVAFHEALLNAIVHRDYSSDGMVSIEFLDDMLTITSPGGFYGGVTSENIFRHEPRHRNKALARLLMEYHYVDRAGMGVARMSLNSLRYGRDFPAFLEKDDNVVVSMEAEYLKPAVFVMSEGELKDQMGVPELVILNSVYGKGHVSVGELRNRLDRMYPDPWIEIDRAVETLPCVELCGTSSDIYVRVTPEWKLFFDVQKSLRLTVASQKYVSLYRFLTRHGSASNADIRAHLGHKHTSQTSEFLRRVSFVKRTGKGPAAQWHLSQGMES